MDAPITLRITTPHNPKYNQTILGVPFNEGQALVSPFNKPNRWGYDPLALAEKFVRELTGFEVEVLDAAGRATPYEPTGYPKPPHDSPEAVALRATLEDVYRPTDQIPPVMAPARPQPPAPATPAARPAAKRARKAPA